MHFEILGRLRVTDDHGRDVVLAGRQAALLGILLMRANEVVASDRLIDEIWGDEPPATPPDGPVA